MSKNKIAFPINSPPEKISYIELPLPQKEVLSNLKEIDCHLGEPEIDTTASINNMLVQAANNGELIQRLRRYPPSEFETKEIRKRFELSTKPYIGYTIGSFGALDIAVGKIPYVLGRHRIHLVTISPHFPRFIYFAKNHGEKNGQPLMPYTVFNPPLNFSQDEKILYLIRKLKEVHTEKDPLVVLIDNPNNPTGGFAHKETIAELNDFALKRNILLIIDEAYADILPERESAIYLTEKYNRVIVIRSFSKAFVPGLRLGYAVMHQNLGEVFSKWQNTFEINAVSAFLIEKSLKATMLIKEAQKAGNIIESWKKELIMGLEKTGLWIAPTHPRTSIIFVKGPPNLCSLFAKYRIHVTYGSSYKELDSQYDDSFARMRIPNSREKVREIIRRVKEFMNVS